MTILRATAIGLWLALATIAVPAYAEAPTSTVAAAAQDPYGLEHGNREPKSFGELLFRSVFVLGGVLVLTWFVVGRALPKLFQLSPAARRSMVAQAPRGLVEVIDRLALDPQRTLYVLKVGGDHLLIGVTPQGMTMISRLDGAALEVAPAPEAEPLLGKFPGLLQRLRQKESG